MSRAVLGISALYHDAAAALVVDGQVVAAASEERFTRVKHDPSLPVRAARWCLEQGGLSAGDLEHVVYYEKPLKKFERVLVTQVLGFPRSFGAFRHSAPTWLKEKLWVRNDLVGALGVASDKLLFSEHHLSHAASAYYCSGFDQAAVLTVDGVGEWATTTLWRGGADGLVPLGELRFPHSIGLVYSAFTAFLGFRVNNGEYKVMGMAPYGEPRFTDQVRRVLKSLPGGGFEVDTRYVAYHYSAKDSYSRAFEELFGPPRFPGAPFDPTTEAGQRYADIAASIQAVTEDLLVELATELHRRTGLSNLCMAGGVALNSVANHAVLTRSPFQRLYVQPAAGDAGGAIGAALWAWHEVMGAARSGCAGSDCAGSDCALRPDLGQAHSDGEIADLLADLRLPSEELDDEAVVARAAEDIAAGKVIGWFQGRFEWGPRALGYRSILASPGSADMKDRINASVKFREPFRPFAPAVTQQAASRYFLLPEGSDATLPWMLMVCPTTELGAAALPATTHVDGSARLQVVCPQTNPRYHALIEAVGARTGHPVVLNTSFNLKGEPIVSSPIYALATFSRSGLDALYMGNHRVEAADD